MGWWQVRLLALVLAAGDGWSTGVVAEEGSLVIGHLLHTPRSNGPSDGHVGSWPESLHGVQEEGVLSRRPIRSRCLCCRPCPVPTSLGRMRVADVLAKGAPGRVGLGAVGAGEGRAGAGGWCWWKGSCGGRQCLPTMRPAVMGAGRPLAGIHGGAAHTPEAEGHHPLVPRLQVPGEGGVHLVGDVADGAAEGMGGVFRVG